MNFQCSWDNTTTGITVSVSIFLIALIAFSFFFVRKYERPKYQRIILIIVAVVIVASTITSILFVPLNVSVQNQSLVIRQLKGNTVIAAEDIKEIRRCTEADTKNSTKVFGSDGLWGYLGIFRNKQLGKHQIYVTNRSNRILVKTNKETIIFNCDQPDELVRFIETIR
jgi:amino acid transporter